MFARSTKVHHLPGVEIDQIGKLFMFTGYFENGDVFTTKVNLSQACSIFLALRQNQTKIEVASLELSLPGMMVEFKDVKRSISASFSELEQALEQGILSAFSEVPEFETWVKEQAEKVNVTPET